MAAKACQLCLDFQVGSEGMFKLLVFFAFAASLSANSGFARSSFPMTLARSSSTHLQALTGDDSDVDRVHWDKLYRESHGYVFGVKPVPFLVEVLPQLPRATADGTKPRALDIAMGEGRNAVYLARNGFDVEGVDISRAAVLKAQRMAREAKVRLNAVTADLDSYKIEKEGFDVIAIFYYLQRDQVKNIVEGLKPGGMLVFESNTNEELKYNSKRNPRELLRKGEIKTLFKGLEIVESKEIDDGTHAFASLLARKPLK